MAWLVRHIAGVGVLLGLVGCSEIFGTRDFADAQVTADQLAGQGSIALTILNKGNDTIFYHTTCLADIEMRTPAGWHAGERVPFGTPVYCIDLGIPPTPIEANGEHRIEWSDLEQWVPGEYRFKPDLRDKDGDLLPDDARISNTFRIQ